MAYTPNLIVSTDTIRILTEKVNAAMNQLATTDGQVDTNTQDIQNLQNNKADITYVDQEVAKARTYAP